MKLIDWINGKTKLNKATFDEFQTNINDGINNISEKYDMRKKHSGRESDTYALIARYYIPDINNDVEDTILLTKSFYGIEETSPRSGIVSISLRTNNSGGTPTWQIKWITPKPKSIILYGILNYTDKTATLEIYVKSIDAYSYITGKSLQSVSDNSARKYFIDEANLTALPSEGKVINEVTFEDTFVEKTSFNANDSIIIAGDSKYNWDTVMNVLNNTKTGLLVVEVQGHNVNGATSMTRQGAPNDSSITKWGTLICLKTTSTFANAQIYIPDNANASFYYRTINAKKWHKISSNNNYDPVSGT